MSNNKSWIRQIKRKAMRNAGLTFAERVRESVRTGKPVKDVMFKKEGKEIVAVAK